ncbi:MAG: carbohydate-binding domain-containing protein [Colwellia sp.]|nr:carbohydate-binding domain-containing protein [Colwellia sp.]
MSNNEKKSIDELILHQANKQDVDVIAETLGVKYKVLTNIPTDKCDKSKADGMCFAVQLSFTASQVINSNEWSIHFSQISPIQSFESEEFSVEHVNGDLHKISLKDTFKGFTAGETKTLMFRAMFWSLSESDALPNYIVSANNIQPRVIESTKPYIDSETGLEVLPYVVPFTDYEQQFKRSAGDSTQWLDAASLYERNAKLGDNKLDVSKVIIPTPKHVSYDENNIQLDLTLGINIDFGNVAKTDVMAAISRLASLGINNNTNGKPVTLSIIKNNMKMIGSYQLTITDTGIKVIGVDGAGVFNGLQSISSLITLGSAHVPLLTATDEPHYEFRGLLIDVARNFHDKDFILTLLDQMAAYKLNKLHLHLGDDEGWRLEIPSLPELTEISSTRCFDLDDQNCLSPQLGAGVDPKSEVNGYYSVADYQEILKAATARHMQVIPSLDMPGHSRAAIKAMAARTKKYAIAEQDDKAKQFNLYDANDPTVYSSVQFYNDNTINVCLESSYDFVTEVMTQVKKMHADAGQPLTRYHIGADETAGAWIESQACIDFIANNDKGVEKMSDLGAYFIERVAGILSDLDIETAGWSDGLEHTRKENMPAIVQSNAWDTLFWGGHNKTHQLVNRDWQVVLSSPDVLYFDFPYEADPKEHGYYWASRHTNTEKIFQFIPDNLPIHAEFWLDREDNAYEADDTKTPMKLGKRFVGIQGQLWSENTRTDNTAQYKLFPRLFALAERSWHLADWAVPYNYQGAKYSKETDAFTPDKRAQRDQQWKIFANAIGQKALAKLENDNIFYRLPTVGAIVKNGKLHTNIAFPGVVIEYKEHGGNWTRYSAPVAVKGEVKVRSISFDGQRKGRSVAVKSD